MRELEDLNQLLRQINKYHERVEDYINFESRAGLRMLLNIRIARVCCINIKAKQC